MASDFLLPFSRLNLLSLSEDKQNQLVDLFDLSSKEAAETFEYGKNNEGYWNGAKLVKQV